MAYEDGDDFIDGAILSFQEANRIKDNFRGSGALANAQPGMLKSDSDDDKLYHEGAAGPNEILQEGVIFGAPILADSASLLGNLTRKFVVTTDNTDAVVTYTAAQILGGLIRRGTGDQLTAARIDVTPTAALIVAAIPEAIVGSGFEFSINNEDSTHTVALDGGVGVTISPNDPSTAIPANSTGRFLAVVTNATLASEAVDIHCIGITGH